MATKKQIDAIYKYQKTNDSTDLQTYYPNYSVEGNYPLEAWAAGVQGGSLGPYPRIMDIFFNPDISIVTSSNYNAVKLSEVNNQNWQLEIIPEIYYHNNGVPNDDNAIVVLDNPKFNVTNKIVTSNGSVVANETVEVKCISVLNGINGYPIEATEIVTVLDDNVAVVVDDMYFAGEFANDEISILDLQDGYVEDPIDVVYLNDFDEEVYPNYDSTFTVSNVNSSGTITSDGTTVTADVNVQVGDTFTVTGTESIFNQTLVANITVVA